MLFELVTAVVIIVSVIFIVVVLINENQPATVETIGDAV